MAIIITDNCTSRGACGPECPNNAIYEGRQEQSYAKGTTLKRKAVLPSGVEIDTDEVIQVVNDDYYFTVADRCTECIGFHDASQYTTVYPVDRYVPDGNHQKTEEELYTKKRFVHNEEQGLVY